MQSVPVLSPVTSETAGGGQTFEVAPPLLCLASPLEGKQAGIEDTQLLGVTVLVPTVLSGFTWEHSLSLLSMLTSCLRSLQHERLLQPQGSE